MATLTFCRLLDFEDDEARRRVDIGLRLSPYDAHVFFSYGLVGLASLSDIASM